MAQASKRSLTRAQGGCRAFFGPQRYRILSPISRRESGKNAGDVAAIARAQSGNAFIGRKQRFP
jgi:hypothetical protein